MPSELGDSKIGEKGHADKLCLMQMHGNLNCYLRFKISFEEEFLEVFKVRLFIENDWS